MNNNLYMKKCCPKCAHYHFGAQYSGNNGLFASKIFSHYLCKNCNHRFLTPVWIQLVSKNTVKTIVQQGINRDIDMKKLIKSFRELCIFLQPLKNNESSNYIDELKNVIENCSRWDSESAAIREAFDRGISFQKKQCGCNK